MENEISIKYKRLRDNSSWTTYEFEALDGRLCGTIKRYRNMHWWTEGVWFNNIQYARRIENKVLSQIKLEILIFATEVITENE